MKPIAIVTLLSAFFATPAFAEYDGVADKVGTGYVGLKAGFTDYVNSPVGYGIYGGYTVVGPGTFTGPFFSKISIAAEGEYVSLGSTDYFYGDYDADAIGVVAAATYPINKQFSATAKAGLARTSDKYTDAGNPNRNYKDANIGIHGGIAGQIHVSQNFGFLAGYDFYPDGIEMISVNVMFKF